MTVLEPRDVPSLAAMLATANAERVPLVPRGGGTRLDRGARLSRGDTTLSLAGLPRDIEHCSGDLTATVSASATIGEVNAQLARAGEDVVLIGRTRPHIDAIIRSGLKVERPDGSWFLAHPKATAEPSTLGAGSVDAVIMLTKSFDTAEASQATAHVLASDGLAISLQNGLGNEITMAASFGVERSLPGVTTVGAQRHEPGRITVSASTALDASISHIAPPRVDDPAAALGRAAAIAAHLSAAGLPTEVKADGRHDIWGKLALAVMGPVSAVLRRTVADTWTQPDAKALVRAMFDEVLEVSAAEGVRLDPDAAWRHAVDTYEGTGTHMTSMCTDVVMGRRTEIEAMAGEVARRARARGIAVPVHDTVVRMIRVLERTYDVAR